MLSSGQRTTIIAEVGVNHNGDLDLAKEIVDKFSNIDIDYFKFQTFDSKSLLVPNAPKAKYQETLATKDVSATEMLNGLSLTNDEFKFLKTHVESKGRKFMSTGFDKEALDFLKSLGATLFKIPSGEITNLPYLRHVAKLADQVLLSTGMSTIKEVEDAVNVLTANGVGNSQITILQCNTAYPSPIRDSNIRAMVSMGHKFGTNYGYSDHTLGSISALAAVALGANVIEKHVTLDKSLPGPDHLASMVPSEFEEYVQAIRDLEVALGSSTKEITESELTNKSAARRGLYASKDLKSGEMLTFDLVSILRPESSISPMEIETVLGKRLKRDLRAYEPINRNNLI